MTTANSYRCPPPRKSNLHPKTLRWLGTMAPDSAYFKLHTPHTSFPAPPTSLAFLLAPASPLRFLPGPARALPCGTPERAFERSANDTLPPLQTATVATLPLGLIKSQYPSSPTGVELATVFYRALLLWRIGHWTVTYESEDRAEIAVRHARELFWMAGLGIWRAPVNIVRGECCLRALPIINRGANPTSFYFRRWRVPSSALLWISPDIFSQRSASNMIMFLSPISGPHSPGRQVAPSSANEQVSVPRSITGLRPSLIPSGAQR